VASWLGLQRLWLHAERLQLTHPVSGLLLVIGAPLPSEWELWNPLG
jgi:tRNA pseudouridine65 synthase